MILTRIFVVTFSVVDSTYQETKHVTALLSTGYKTIHIPITITIPIPIPRGIIITPNTPIRGVMRTTITITPGAICRF
jgi:hypothetical protein